MEEAVNMANDTEFGLSFSLFTRDITTALKVAKQSNAGMVHINAMSIQDEPHVPFGGNGMSGFGREGTDADEAAKDITKTSKPSNILITTQRPIEVI